MTHHDLSALVRDHVTSGEPPFPPPHGVLDRGRRRLRRRRSAAFATGGLAVTLAVAAAATLPGGSGPDPASDGLVGPVITLDDAQPATEGVDYRVLATRERGNGNGASQRFAGITDDGLAVVVDRSDTSGEPTRIGLLDPDGDHLEWLPGGRQRVYEPMALTEDRLVFRESHWSERRLAVRVFDRTAGTWTTLRWPALPRAQSYGGAVHDGRLYTKLYTDRGRHAMELWSVSLDDTSDVRDEGLDVDEFDITGDELTWVGSEAAADRPVHVRDLRTGDEHVVEPPMGDDCGIVQLERVGDSLLLSQGCGPVGDETRLQVVTTAGDPVVTVRGDGAGANVADGGRVAVISGGEGGPFVLDPATGELWKVGARMSWWTRGGPVPDGSPFTTWTTTTWVWEGGPGPDEPDGDDVYTDTEWLVEWLTSQ